MKNMRIPVLLVMTLLTAGASRAGGKAVLPVKLPDVMVTATRSEKEEAALPFTTGLVSAEVMQMEKLSRTSPEALREIPSVMVQKTGHGQGSPFIRGFTGFRTLFLIDGIRLNNSTFRDGPNQYWNTVDPFCIESMEIVKGPGSVLYGSDAVGGTVNALTCSVFDDEADRAASGRAYYRYSTAEDSHTVRAEGRGTAGGKAGIRAGATVRDFGDLRSGGGDQPKTGYDEVDFDIRAEYLINPNLRLSAAHQTVEQDDAWRTHKTIYGESFHGTTVGDEKKRVLDQERHLSYIAFDAADLSGFIRDLNLTVSHQRQEEDQFRIKKDDTSDIQGYDVDTFGVSLQAVSPTRAGEWIYGAEYYRDSVDSYLRKYRADGSLKSIGIQGPVGDDAVYETVGAYIQDLVPLSDRLDMVVGARCNYAQADVGRYEDTAADGPGSLKEDWDEAVGSVRLLYRLLPDGGLNLFAGVSQGFRAPNLSDLTRLDTARTDELEVPSPGLDPETYLAYEAGIRGGSDKASFELVYYYTDMKDMIVRTPTGCVIDEYSEVVKKNAGDGFIHGIELSARRTFAEVWTLWGNCAWMEGEVDTYPTSLPEKKREPVSRLMPLTANAGIRFQPAEKYWLEAVVTAADRQDKLSTSDASDTQRIPPGGTPGYGVFTVRGGWHFTKNLTMSAALENIADKDYRIHGSGLNEPGRNLVVALDCKF